MSHTAQDFLASWWRGDAGPVPCGGCSACCYYKGIVADKKRDRRRLPHLLTERNREGELVLQRRADGDRCLKAHPRLRIAGAPWLSVVGPGPGGIERKPRAIVSSRVID